MFGGDLDCVCVLCFTASPLSFKIYWHRDALTDLILLIFLIYHLRGSLTTGIAGFLISG